MEKPDVAVAATPILEEKVRIYTEAPANKLF
jgi:hypothetical protein